MSSVEKPIEEVVDAVAGVDQDEAKLTDHSYDGIQEYDNPMPGWWVWLFVGTVVFSMLYLLYFESGMPGRTIQDEYDAASAASFEQKFSEIGQLTGDRATLVKYMNDKKWLAVGRVTYKTNCVSCHGANGEGGIGPNLTDDNWKNVKNVEDIASVISNGAANGAMPSWKNRLSHPNFIVLTAAYIASLRGSNPANSKAPEGNVIPAWPEPTASPDAAEESNPAEDSAPAE